MKQDRISEITRKAIDVPKEITQSLMEKTERIKRPSPRVDKIGRFIGTCVGVVLLLMGSVELLFGESSWAIGTLFIGTLTILSNIFCHSRKKR